MLRSNHAAALQEIADVGRVLHEVAGPAAWHAVGNGVPALVVNAIDALRAVPTRGFAAVVAASARQLAKGIRRKLERDATPGGESAGLRVAGLDAPYHEWQPDVDFRGGS